MTAGQYIVVRQGASGAWTIRGPIAASSPEEAIVFLASGFTKYLPAKRGRYHAIPLDVWQAGTFDWTQVRGIEPVF